MKKLLTTLMLSAFMVSGTAAIVAAADKPAAKEDKAAAPKAEKDTKSAKDSKDTEKAAGDKKEKK